MKKYILMYETVVNGISKIIYHKGIYEVPLEKIGNNIYGEYLTSKKDHAQIFYEENEALNIVKLFENPIKISFVIIKTF